MDLSQPSTCEQSLTRLNTAMIMMTAVVMVARGRRTNGRLTTASDTAGSHRQPDSFSGNRRCSEVRGKKDKMQSNRYEQHVTFFTVSYLQTACMSESQLALSRKGICLRRKPKKTACPEQNVRCHLQSQQGVYSKLQPSECRRQFSCHVSILRSSNSGTVRTKSPFHSCCYCLCQQGGWGLAAG